MKPSGHLSAAEGFSRRAMRNGRKRTIRSLPALVCLLSFKCEPSLRARRKSWSAKGIGLIQKEIIRRSRILIVDDQPANVLLLERILQTGGYTNLSQTTDPRQVLEFFTVYKPDLILLDLMMPNVDGYSLLTQLRSRIPDNHYLPILVLTADVTPKAKQQALTLGAKDFLTKPLDATEVLLRVYNLLETRWLSLQLQEQVKTLEEKAQGSANSPE